MLAHQLVTHYERKHIPPCVLLKIDICKAYDTVSWDFLEAALWPLIFWNILLKSLWPVYPHQLSLLTSMAPLLVSFLASGMSGNGIPSPHAYLFFVWAFCLEG